MNFEDAKTCAECGGACCKRHPGACFPADFGDDESEILSAVWYALGTGMYAINWWEGDPAEEDDRGRSLFVQPAVIGKQGPWQPIWNGVCVFLRPDGCSLAHDERPQGCRDLEPHAGEDGECVDHGGGTQAAALAWRGMSKELEQMGYMMVGRKSRKRKTNRR